MKKPDPEYLDILKKRSGRSRVYKRFQLIGLLIAMYLKDERHKSLYIKLAKEGDADFLLSLARNISERSSVKNKGAYFMRMLSHQNFQSNKKSKPKTNENPNRQ